MYTHISILHQEHYKSYATKFNFEFEVCTYNLTSFMHQTMVKTRIELVMIIANLNSKLNTRCFSPALCYFIILFRI